MEDGTGSKRKIGDWKLRQRGGAFQRKVFEGKKEKLGSVEALRPDDPHSCQVDARFQPRLGSGSVVPAKDVRTLYV